MSSKRRAVRVSSDSPEMQLIFDQVRELYAQRNPQLTWRQIGLKLGVTKSVVERAIKSVPKRQSPARVASRIKKMLKSRKRNKQQAPGKKRVSISDINAALDKSNAETDKLDSVLHQLQSLFPGVRKLLVDLDKRQVLAERVEFVVIGNARN